MKKINNKGYMLIEIIIAAGITFTIAFSLINLIIKFKNRNEDIYSQTSILNDKITITKNIMDDLNDYTIVGLENNSNGNKYIIDLTAAKEETRVDKRIEIKNKQIEYGDYNKNTNKFITNNKSYYKKTISNFIDIGTPNIKDNNESNNKIMTLTIPINSIYTNDKNSINIFLKTRNLYKVTYDDNLFTSASKTQNGIEIVYDETAQMITLNGKTTSNKFSFEILRGITFNENDKYIVKLNHISGDYTTTASSNTFVLDFQKDLANYSDRKNGTHYITTTLPIKKIETSTITYKLTDANGMNFWFMHNSGVGNQTTFNNYKIQVSVSKEHSKYIEYGKKYEVEQPSSRGTDYEFDGWYDEINGGNKIDENTDMLKTKDHTLYAHWKKTV